MIKIFRKIRQRMLTENKFSKYLLYAIGEIVLVMIGILLALQVNNWNTQRIEKESVQRLSVRLLAETKRNIVSTDEEISQVTRAKNSSLSLLHFMTENYTELDEREIDSLVSSSYFLPSLNFNSAAMSEAFSTGETSNFSNDSLKDLIYSIPTQVEYIQQVENSLADANEYLAEFLFENFSLREMDYLFSSTGQLLGESKLADVDNRTIMSMQRFENIMDEQYYSMNILKGRYEEFNTNLKALYELLEVQLDANRE